MNYELSLNIKRMKSTEEKLFSDEFYFSNTSKFYRSQSYDFFLQRSVLFHFPDKPVSKVPMGFQSPLDVETS